MGTHGATATLPAGDGKALSNTDYLVGSQLAATEDTEMLIAGNIENRASQLLRDAQQSALVTGIITVAVPFIVLLAALLVARSLVLPLRRLRVGALDAASVQLSEQARNRLAGFQRGTQRAAGQGSSGQGPRAGEGTNR